MRRSLRMATALNTPKAHLHPQDENEDHASFFLPHCLTATEKQVDSEITQRYRIKYSVKKRPQNHLKFCFVSNPTWTQSDLTSLKLRIFYFWLHTYKMEPCTENLLPEKNCQENYSLAGHATINKNQKSLPQWADLVVCPLQMQFHCVTLF